VQWAVAGGKRARRGLLRLWKIDRTRNRNDLRRVQTGRPTHQARSPSSRPVAFLVHKAGFFHPPWPLDPFGPPSPPARRSSRGHTTWAFSTRSSTNPLDRIPSQIHRAPPPPPPTNQSKRSELPASRSITAQPQTQIYAGNGRVSSRTIGPEPALAVYPPPRSDTGHSL
jgi:hypothetical protein